MTRDSPLDIDIALKDVQCLMLVFKRNKALGTWASPRVINDGNRDVALVNGSGASC